MRGLLPILLLLRLAGCSLSDDGWDCLGDGPRRYFDPDAASCREIATHEGGCRLCGGGAGCTDRDRDALDLAACGTCGDVDEAACIDRPGCVAAYVDGAFLRCEGTPPSGTISEGACSGFTAQECSRRDRCSLSYRTIAGRPVFDHCVDEAHTRMTVAPG